MNTEKKYLRTIDNFLSQEECQDLIQHAEKLGFEEVDRSIAKYDRVILINQELSQKLFQRLQQKIDLPEYFDGHKIICLNDHFRFSKYHPGNEFGIHKDGINQDTRGNRSIMTLNIFLNDQFTGGETDFFWNDKSFRYSAKPEAGRAALFDSQQYHCGNKVQDGYKYLLRTDVMVGF